MVKSTCVHCDDYDGIMTWVDALVGWLCTECYTNYFNNAPMKAYCDECEVEFYTTEPKGPFICAACAWNHLTKVETTYDLPTIVKENKMDTMCVERAIETYMYYHRADVVGPSKVITKVNDYIRQLYGILPNDIGATARIKDLSVKSDSTLKETVRKLYEKKIFEEAVKQVLDLQLEYSWGAYEAKKKDRWMTTQENYTFFQRAYVKQLEGSFCLREDDKLAECPFLD